MEINGENDDALVTTYWLVMTYSSLRTSPKHLEASAGMLAGKSARLSSWSNAQTNIWTPGASSLLVVSSAGDYLPSLQNQHD